MSELNDRLTKIAERGTPRGFDDVFTEASKRADTLDVVPMVEEISARDRKPRRPYRSLVAAAGVTSLLLVGMLAISALVGNGGASSPEAAVRQLADAVSHEDPLAAADVLAPNEVRSLARLAERCGEEGEGARARRRCECAADGCRLLGRQPLPVDDEPRRRLRQGHRRRRIALGEHLQGQVLGADAEGVAQRRQQLDAGRPREADAGSQPAELRHGGEGRWQLVRERGVHRARVLPGVQQPSGGRLRFGCEGGGDVGRRLAGRRRAGRDACAAGAATGTS